MYFLNKSSIKLKINRKFWSNCMTKMNIKIEKTFINMWQTSIDDAIYTKIVKDMSLIVTFVNVKNLIKKKKILHFTWMSTSFKKIDINYVHMFASKTMKTMIIVRNDLIEWIKTCVLFNFKIDTIVKFIWQDVINRHECFDITILNEDFENKKIIKQLLQRYRIKVKIISFYHSMINDIIKRDHQFIVDALSKLTNDKFEM